MTKSGQTPTCLVNQQIDTSFITFAYDSLILLLGISCVPVPVDKCSVCIISKISATVMYKRLVPQCFKDLLYFFQKFHTELLSCNLGVFSFWYCPLKVRLND